MMPLKPQVINKRTLGLLAFLFFFRLGNSQGNGFPGIIPQPVTIKMDTGVLKLQSEVHLLYNDSNAAREVRFFFKYLKEHCGMEITMGLKKKPYSIISGIEYPKPDKHPESYQINIQRDGIYIMADRGSTGYAHAIRTLIQIVGDRQAENGVLTLPKMIVYDYPRFAWRGMHLDVCRHFFDVDAVKRYIDVMTFYKFNIFHWHLTDDQGWRIEIKKYPELTKVGAWRKGTMVGKYDDHKFDSTRYGGFYTQAEIREVVNYAQEKHITIVPEIEMPGHAVAAIASYPYLSCTGKKIEVEKGWGVFDDVYCCKDETFTFLTGVLDEVVALFPGEYIHIGGDECPKTRWKTCPTCQRTMHENQLKDEHELQSFFVRRIELYLNSKKKKIIGWDEILEGGLAPNAAVMSWRGTEGGIQAARMKHKVVMSPGKPCYFDHYQTAPGPKVPLAIGGFNPLDSVYAYEPLPSVLDGAEGNYIMGAQCNLWTEYILSEKHLQYMAFPRACALAEVLWTPKEKKDYKDFLLRLKSNSKFLDQMQVNYARYFLNQ